MSILINCFEKMTERSNSKNEIKGYKVTNVDRTRKFGIACRNFKELKQKACVKFDISKDVEKNVAIFLVDGSTEIDDEYFETLKPQTTSIILKPGEKLLSDADILYNTLKQVNLEFLTTGDAASKFLSQNLKSKIAFLNKVLNKNDSKTILSSRDDHPEWFEHLDTSANTKEAYMHRRCQDRIRSYLYKTIEQIKSSEIYLNNEIARRQLTNVILFFKLQLREDHCMGYYFDRSYAKSYKNNQNHEDEIRTPRLNDNVDELDDGLFNCPYDHCPCKMEFGKIQNFYYNNSEEFLKKCFLDYNKLSKVSIAVAGAAAAEPEIEIEIDELDARKIKSSASASSSSNSSSPKKKLKTKYTDELENHSNLPCLYKISEINKEHSYSLCDNKGEFYCDGIWNADRCAYGERHCINPYRSYEELVLFSTWNFDHRIERSRTLIPNLLKAASEDNKMSQRDVRYFYDSIFTIKNLRLVHIICHDKGAHFEKQ